MFYLVLKTALSAMMIVAAGEIAKRSTALGALIIALPLNSILALTWLYLDTGDRTRVGAMSTSILLLIAPSLIFFVLMTLALRAGLGFGLALLGACVVTALAYWLWSLVLARLGISL